MVMLSMLSSNRRSSSGLYCEMGFSGGFRISYSQSRLATTHLLVRLFQIIVLLLYDILAERSPVDTIVLRLEAMSSMYF